MSTDNLYSIPSPYNFVPLNREVFIPSWGDKVSHDIPFKESVCDRLEIRLTACSDIYIRNGGIFSAHSKNLAVKAEAERKEYLEKVVRKELKEAGYSEEESEEKIKAIEKEVSEYISFFRCGGKYMIPGTTLKGMLRNIVEIISFGKIGQFTDDGQYGARITKREDRGRDKKDKFFESKAKSGWLIHRNNKWFLQRCEYARVEQADLEKYYKRETNACINLGIRSSEGQKYRDWKKLSLDVSFDMEQKDRHFHESCGQLIYKKAVVIKPVDKNARHSGKLVFTGQPSNRNDNARKGKSRGKHMEFIFYNAESAPQELDDELIKRFLCIHSDRNKEPLALWKFWLDETTGNPRKPVPVFYLEQENNSNNIYAMGLAQMFRLPWETSVHQAIAKTAEKHCDKDREENRNKGVHPFKPDLAQLMFGYVHGVKALKGRIQVGHLICEENPEPKLPVRTILGTPRPSYYPNYLEQPENKGDKDFPFKTWMDKDVTIKGWKRYPVQAREAKAPKSKGADNVSTCFEPLPENTCFRGSIYFHNLRPEELGALLWAIKWGGKQGEDTSHLRHNLGMAKPYGFGKVKLEILKGSTISDFDFYIQRFEEEMEKNIGKKNKPWKESEQIKELLAMADPAKARNHNLNYPALASERIGFEGKNEFVFFKKRNNHHALRPYSQYQEFPAEEYKK